MAPDADATAGASQGWHDLEAVLAEVPAATLLAAYLDPAEALARTEAHWCDWIGRFCRHTEWPEAVRRSLLTIKALIHPPSGGLVAAPTLGLPERSSGAMNCDYR